MAEDRNPGLDNQERPEHEPMEQGYELPQNSPRLPDQEADDDDTQNPSEEDER